MSKPVKLILVITLLAAAALVAIAVGMNLG